MGGGYLGGEGMPRNVPQPAPAVKKPGSAGRIRRFDGRTDPENPNNATQSQWEGADAAQPNRTGPKRMIFERVAGVDG